MFMVKLSPTQFWLWFCSKSTFFTDTLYISFNLTFCDICTGSSAVFQLARQPLWTFLVWQLLVECLLFLQLLKGCNFPIGLLPVFVLKFHLDFHPKSQLRSSDNSTGVNQSRRDQVGNTLRQHHLKTKKTLLENSILSKTSRQAVPQFPLGLARLCSNSVPKSCH